jgi:tetratricopeptide (TPR) repeat protein
VVTDRDVRARLAVTVSQLETSADPTDREAAELLTYLGLWNGEEITPSTAAALCLVPVARAERALERLVDAQLMLSPAPCRYTFSGLVSALARERAMTVPATTSRRALDELAAWYVATTLEAGKAIDGIEHATTLPPPRVVSASTFSRRHEAFAWLDSQLGNLLALARQLIGVSDFPRELLNSLRGYFILTVRWCEQHMLCDLVLRDAKQRGDRRGEAIALACSGVMSGQQGDGSTAVELLCRSSEIFRELGDTAEEQGARGNLIAALSIASRYAEAVDVGQQLLADVRRTRHRPAEAPTLSNLGYAYLSLGLHDKGQQHLRHAADLGALLNQFTVTVTALASLANSHQDRDEHDAAIACFTEVLELHGRRLDTYVAVSTQYRLARSLRAVGRVGEADLHRTNALARVDELSTRERVELSVLLDSP